jgi:hypothetical protein
LQAARELVAMGDDRNLLGAWSRLPQTSLRARSKEI